MEDILIPYTSAIYDGRGVGVCEFRWSRGGGAELEGVEGVADLFENGGFLDAGVGRVGGFGGFLLLFRLLGAGDALFSQ